MKFIFDAAVERGRIIRGEPEEKKWAFSLVHELSAKIVTPPSFFVYTMLDDDRLYDVELRTTEAGDQFDGESDFCHFLPPHVGRRGTLQHLYRVVQARSACTSFPSRTLLAR